jgi:CheY-like chemotaxis protein
VEVRVADDGGGIPREIRDKIFDPFFTTKERGRGTGLGLSVVYSIVRNHHGVLLVDSEEGKGSTFRIILPAISSETECLDSTEVKARLPGKNEVVLVVDDEESMQELARDLLEEAGYQVLTVSSGKEAIEVYCERKEEVDLVVLDLVMPGMDGAQTYLELRKIKPELKAFFCTGFMPNEITSSLLKDNLLQSVQKPFQPDAFVDLVRKTLDRK